MKKEGNNDGTKGRKERRTNVVREEGRKMVWALELKAAGGRFSWHNKLAAVAPVCGHVKNHEIEKGAGQINYVTNSEGGRRLCLKGAHQASSSVNTVLSGCSFRRFH